MTIDGKFTCECGAVTPFQRPLIELGNLLCVCGRPLVTWLGNEVKIHQRLDVRQEPTRIDLTAQRQSNEP